jgi:hypothetical protein
MSNTQLHLMQLIYNNAEKTAELVLDFVNKQSGKFMQLNGELSFEVLHGRKGKKTREKGKKVVKEEERRGEGRREKGEWLIFICLY